MNLSEFSTADLFKLHHDVLMELRNRDSIRSGNSTVSDYAESLACKALKLTRTKQSTRGYDGTDEDGRKHQIKARMLGSASARQLGAIRGLLDDEPPFDFLIG